MQVRSRAERYSIDATIYYRERGAKLWMNGRIQNVSTTGVLIEADQPLPLGTAVEMRFALPVNRDGKAGAEVSCRGAIVRIVSPHAPGGTNLIALTIQQSRLRRPVM